MSFLVCPTIFYWKQNAHFLSLSLVKHPTHQKPNHSPDETSLLVPKTIPFSLAKIIQNPHVLPVVKVPPV